MSTDTRPDTTPAECPDICARQAAAQLLGPLRPDVCVCAHGVRRRLDDVFPPAMHSCDGCGQEFLYDPALHECADPDAVLPTTTWADECVAKVMGPDA